MELRCALHQNLSIAYKEIRNYPRALHHTLAHLDLVQSSEDVETLLPLAHHNAGKYYEMVKDYTSALKHHEVYLMLAKEKRDKVAMATAYASLGYVYQILCNFKLAEMYLEQHLHMVNKLKDNDKQAKALCSLGDLNLAKEDFDKALSYFERYLRVSRRLDEYETECRAFLKIGDVFKSQGRHQHAQYYYEMAAAVGEKLNDNVDLVNLCRCEGRIALTLSISKDDMEKARLVFDELIPFYTKKIHKCDSESIECVDELKTALQNCYDGVQITLCKLDQADMALSYAEAYRQQKFEQILKQKLSTDEEEPRNENETSKMLSLEELIKIVNRQ
ncbi:G-protein-signaling modulator 2-like [Ptychodera flava]|uniref:G-protein-signaling modulator 2-like n=1 Tax=Ptychodera flava TaxID=63121 RepID=UPI003969E242